MSIVFPPLALPAVISGLGSSAVGMKKCAARCAVCEDVQECSCYSGHVVTGLLDVATLGAALAVGGAARAVQAGVKGAQLVRAVQTAKTFRSVAAAAALANYASAPNYENWEQCILQFN